jgi:hypothetical protein
VAHFSVSEVVQFSMSVDTIYNGCGEVKEAGWLEIDLVAHCGKWRESRFLWTLVATDIATGWSEWLPLLNRDGASVMAALRMLEELLPAGHRCGQ